MNVRPAIVVTGASGFIGRHFIQQFKDEFYIYAFARRSQHAVGIPEHPNIHWMRLDIRDELKVERTMNEIAARGGARFILHLAGYYDFSNRNKPEYVQTNVNGTRHILRHAEKLGIERFIFTSSLTVTRFENNHGTIDENSPADATFPYAVSKRRCEQIIKEYSQKFPCAVLRLAAIFSDWCEYGPLYMFLMTWLSRRWNARIIAGKGETGIPYLHVNNLNSFILQVMRKSKQLPRYGLYIASPDGCTTHNELYHQTMRYVFGQRIKPIHLPKTVAAFGLVLRDVSGRLIGRRPFERPWMLRYVDKQLNVDASFSRKTLEWLPSPRFNIKRRLLFLIENMKTNPLEWKRKNQEAIYKTGLEDPNLLILEAMLEKENEIIERIVSLLGAESFKNSFHSYKQLPSEEFRRRVEYIYEILKRTVRSGDRLHSLTYARELAMERIRENFDVDEVLLAVHVVGTTVTEVLTQQPQLKHLKERVRDEIMLAIQLIADEVADVYERITGFRINGNGMLTPGLKTD